MDKTSELAAALEQCIRESTEGKDVAVAFSGGIDSTLIAHIGKKYAKSMKLITVGTETGEDIASAREIGKELGIEPEIHILDGNELMSLFGETCMMMNAGYLKTEILAPILKLLKLAAAEKRTLLLGSAAEELFAGYRRHYEWVGKDWEEIRKNLNDEYRKLGNGGDISAIRAMAEKAGCEVCFPLYDERIERIAHFNMDIKEHFSNDGLKKPMLRKAASLLGVPIAAIERKKKALQYGSGVDRFYSKNRKELGKMFPDCMERSGTSKALAKRPK
jgi:asparagine synthase (glutamine-hydrolysing)